MTELIKRFEAANPTIKVKQNDLPCRLRDQAHRAIPAGQGPT